MHGVLLFREIYVKDQYMLDIKLYNNDLQPIWGGYLPVDDYLYLAAFDVYEGNIAFLFAPRDINSQHMEIIYMRSSDGNYNYYMVDNKLPVYFAGFKITRFGALIGGYYDDRPLVYFFDYSTQQSKILPGFVNEPGELIQMQAYEDGSYEIITRGEHILQKQTLWIKYFSPLGNLLKSDMISSDPANTLLTGRSMLLPGREQVLAGTYGNPNFDKSKGIFIVKIDEDKNQKLQLYNYGELENFFSYMKQEKQEKLQQKIQRKKITGKKLRYKYRVIIDDIFEHNDQLVFIGHAYYPFYRYMRSSYANTLMSGYLTRGKVLTDYRFTHAIILGISKEGKLLWDNSFELNNVLNDELKPFVRAYQDTSHNSIALLYVFDNTVRSKIIQENKVLTGKSIKPLNLSLSGDQIFPGHDSRMAGLENWYDNYFLSYGIQTIRNKNGSKSKFRRVFFLNKLSYEQAEEL